MKRKLIVLLIALIAAITPSTGLAGNKQFLKEVSSLPNVKYTNINTKTLRSEDGSMTITMSEFIKEIKSIEIINCGDDTTSINKLNDFTKKLVEENNLELLISNSSNNQSQIVYGLIPEKKSDTSTLFLIMKKDTGPKYTLEDLIEKNSYVMVYITGIVDWKKVKKNFMKQKND